MINLLKLVKRIMAFLSPRVPNTDTSRTDYIGGGEALPEPLTAEREAQLLAEFGAGSQSARDSLIEHNLRLVVYISKRFENTGTELEDLISVGTIGLIKAVNSFSPDKNIKLATFASRCIENEILMYLRKLQKQRGEVSFEEPLNVDSDGNILVLSDILGTEGDEIYRELEDNLEKDILYKLFATLPKREREILQMRFGLQDTDELTQKEIADTLGISQSYISRLEKKIIQKLKKEMEKALK